MTLRALRIRNYGDVIAYCLRAYTSGKTQPLNVGLYGPFKNYLNSKFHAAQQSHTGPEFEHFDLLHMIRRAYYRAFTVPKVVKAFRKACLWPLNTDFLLGASRPKSAEEPDVMVDSKALTEMVNALPELVQKDKNLQPFVLHRGTVQTKQGLLVTAEKAMGMIAEELDKVRAKEAEKQRKEEDAAAQLEPVRLPV